jgi:AcrR family transcriptional regulator/DNA-binding MarR family transcriptional regulator
MPLKAQNDSHAIRKRRAKGVPQDGTSHRDNGREPTRVTDIQRARLLNAMAEAASEQGIVNVTVADVVARSGVSRRTFYEHFSDRDDCFLATLEAAIERAASVVVPVYERHERWPDRIRASLEELLCFFDEEPSLGRLLIMQTLGAGQRALDRRRELTSVLTKAIDAGLAESRSPAGVPTLTAEGIVGAVLAVIHARVLDEGREPLVELTNELMSMIVLPYLGVAAARRELTRTPRVARPVANAGLGLLRDLDMRLTYRTVRVLLAIGEHPGASNRQVAEEAEIHDQGQMSKLLRRLGDLGLIRKAEESRTKGEPNAWTLTERGAAVREAISGDALAQ